MQIIIVNEAEELAGELFQASLGFPVPDFGKHYVALQKSNPFSVNVLGYCHKTIGENYELLGGLVVNPEFRARGVGKLLVQYLLDDFAPTSLALFTYTGSPISRKIGFGLGMQSVGPDQLLVSWRDGEEAADHPELIAEIRSRGPF